MDTVSNATHPPAEDLKGLSDASKAYSGGEYDVVRLRLESLTLAYACFALVFVWFRVYWWLIREGWFWAFTGGGVIALIGTLSAYRAWRKTRTFPSLVALLLDGGLLASILVPMTGFFLVAYKIV